MLLGFLYVILVFLCIESLKYDHGGSLLGFLKLFSIIYWLFFIILICFLFWKNQIVATNIPLSDWRLSLFKSPSLGGLPPRQQDCCRRDRRLLSSQPQQQEGHVLWHQPVQQPRALLGSSANHLPLRLRPLRHPARQLQEEVERPARGSVRL